MRKENKVSSANSYQANGGSEGRMSIEQEINVIFKALCDSVSKESEVKRESPAKLSTCRGVVNVYSKKDSGVEVGKKRIPTVSYMFYASAYDSRRLGSVAIYGDYAMFLFSRIRKTGNLFGRKIREVSLEKGMRTYVVVKFA